ncbi:unnamed protein product [Lymnaea stagnalis]|uniref:Serine/threonine-protein phosphatase 1 regulatory subunit 10 n=1 Tax=Lymnaea stagnalis TaxID=6523 RepID=A0AAV2HBA0_LYMST
MPPIDPHQLLRALGPLLTPAGGIKGPQEASRIASLMKDATKLVTRCIYLNILRATESHEALEKFIDVGGWNILNSWLDVARGDNNDPLLGELLDVYLLMPVTVVLLKQNSAAKTIKQLSKTENEKIKTLSSKLVDSWTKTIRGQNNGTDNDAEDKKKKKKHKEKEREKDKNDKENDKREKEEKDSEKNKSREKDSKDHHKEKDKRDKDRHKDKDRSKREKSKSSSDNKESSTKGSSSSDPTLSSKTKESSSSKRSTSMDELKSSSSSTTTNGSGKNVEQDFLKDDDSRRRPKTVKQLNTKFRSTGLFDAEEEEEPEQAKKKLDKPPMKRASMDSKSEDAIEKKPRLHLTMPTLTPASSDSAITTPPEVTHGRIKIIPPKKAPAHEIQESNVFMTALQQSTLPGGLKRKKKLLVSPSPMSTTPLLIRGSSATSPPSASSPSATSPPPSTQTSEAGPTSPPLLSPTTVMAQKLPSVPSFYRDTLEDMPESTNSKKDKERDENEDPPPALEVMQTDEEGEGRLDDQTSSTSEEKISESKPEGELIPGDVSLDSDPKPVKVKKPKKNVTWARETNLEEYFYFELDETERENVNRPKTFNEMKKEEMLLDRRAMESAKRFNNDTMVEVLQWKRPKPIDNVIVVVESGCNSVEKQIQMDRELIVLCALFFNKVPDTPAEPDLENSGDKLETQIIPLEDENGSCTEYEHTYKFNDPSSLPYDPEFGGLPLQSHVPPMNQVGPMVGPLMNNMSANIIAGNMNNNMGGNTMGNMNLPPAISHILNTLQQQAQESRDPVIQNLQGMLASVLQNTNPQDSGMLMDRILTALEPFKNQIPGLGNLINSVTGNGMDPNMGPRFMGPNQMGNPRHGLLGSAPPGFNMMGGNMRPNMPAPGPMMNNNPGGMGGNYYMGGGGGGGMRMGGPHGQWRGRSRPYGKRGGPRNVVCQFYVKKGNCKYGDVCQFIHPGPNS